MLDASAATMSRVAVWRSWAGPLSLLPALLILPWVGGDFVAYQVALFLLYGVAAQGVALCWGQLGFLPLGHALFFGLGAYLSAGLLKAASHQALWLALLPLALLLPAALAWVIARLVFARSHRSGPYFSLITLALTMLGALLANRFSALTGGFNGMTGIPELPGLERYSTMYWAVAALALASTLALSFMIRRPIGVLWSAIAQNEDRLQFFGFATDRIKARAFALSALCAAAAGALFAPLQGIVTPQALGFVLSTEFVIWAAVGGKSSPLGALLGAVLVGYASSELRDHFASWEVIVAVAFILVVRFLPEGVSGLFARRASPSRQAPPADVLAPALPRSATGDAGTPALVFDGVKSAHAGVAILNGLSLRFEGPGVRCLIGPNGAGKTSAFNVLTGRLPAQSGRMRLGGSDVSGWSAWRVARAGLGRKFQIPSVFARLTVRENLAIALWAHRLRGWQALASPPLRWRTPLRDEMLHLFPTLAERLDAPAGQLAQGDRQALEFVMTVLPEPRLMLLDEPCAGLSSAETQRMMRAIASVTRHIGAAALVIEHDMGAVEAIAERVYVMHQGQLLAEGSLAEIQIDPAVRAVYAGGRK